MGFGDFVDEEWKEGRSFGLSGWNTRVAKNVILLTKVQQCQRRDRDRETPAKWAALLINWIGMRRVEIAGWDVNGYFVSREFSLQLCSAWLA